MSALKVSRVASFFGVAVTALLFTTSDLRAQQTTGKDFAEVAKIKAASHELGRPRSPLGTSAECPQIAARSF